MNTSFLLQTHVGAVADAVARLPWYAWLVLGIAIVAAFLLLFFRGFSFKKGDGEFGTGLSKSAYKKIQSERESEKADAERRMVLYRASLDIDSRCEAALRRRVRDLEDDLFKIFTTSGGCEFPSLTAVSFVKSELFQRIDNNNLRERLASSEIKGYVKDICNDIEGKYRQFLSRTSRAHCGEKYPEWEDIQPQMKTLIENWTLDVRDTLAKYIRQKIDRYRSAESNFLTEEYKKSSVLEPIEKNLEYLRILQGE